jgi:hypothetical protein
VSKIRYKEGYKYQLAETYQHQLPFEVPMIKLDHDFIEIGANNLLTIAQGYAYDGPSGPTVDTANFMRGSLVHDALYQLMRDGRLDRGVYKDLADRELQRICIEDGMSKMRAWYVYMGVKLGGKSATEPRTNDVIEAP